MLAAREKKITVAGHSKLANARQMMRLFVMHEVANVVVKAGETSATTDDEGYFLLKLPRLEHHSGWVDVARHIDDLSFSSTGEGRAICGDFRH